MTPKDIALCSVFTVALPIGQLLFKTAAIYDQRLTGPIVLRAAVNPALIGAFVWYGLTSLLWFYMLTRVPLSAAYAFSIAGSCLVPLAAWLIFKEPASWTMAIGYLLMIGGLSLIVIRPA